ncbi:MAG: NifB/NifX family molybdenum-iron cluster-binding protein [Anaerolineae bacterium]
MRIAIAAESNNGLDSPVSPHFGHAAYFVLVDIDSSEIKLVSSIANPFCGSHGCGPVGKFVAEQGTHVMLVGGMGRRAMQALQAMGIKAVTGATGSVHEALQHYLNGELQSTMPCQEEGSHGGCHD